MSDLHPKPTAGNFDAILSDAFAHVPVTTRDGAIVALASFIAETSRALSDAVGDHADLLGRVERCARTIQTIASEPAEAA